MTHPEDHVHVNGQTVRVPAGSARLGAGPRVIVRFAGPIASAWPARVAAIGCRIDFWCAPSGTCMTLLRGNASTRLAALPFVAGFVPYPQEHCHRAL